jgi:DNA-binding transcriptional LysR family regulator
MDRLDAMQVLLAVVDEGSLSAGSRKLGAPLPSVSRKVAELERHLGTRLLIRTSRNVQLTDAGRDYVEAVRQIVAQLQEAELRASGEYELPRGELTITVPMQFGQVVVNPLAYRFLDEHPEITLSILSLDRLVSFVDEHVDVGVRLGDLADSSLYALKVGEVSLVTCASPDYLERCGRPESPQDLPQHDAATFGQLNQSAWTYSCNGETFEGLPRIKVRTNTSDAAVTAALQGVGVTRVLNFMVADHVRSGRLVPILDDYDGGSMPVHLVYVRQGLLPLKVRAFLDWMVPQLKKRLTELAGDCCSQAVRRTGTRKN